MAGKCASREGVRWRWNCRQTPDHRKSNWVSSWLHGKLLWALKGSEEIRPKCLQIPLATEPRVDYNVSRVRAEGQRKGLSQ